MAVTMPPLDVHSARPGSGGSLSARGPSTGGFQHLTFDSSVGLGGKSAERERLRNKLVDVGQRFVGFDKVIEDDCLKRRTQEVKKFQAVHEGTAKLEKAMNLEIRKRVDTNKQIQEMTERMANEMLERIQEKILTRIEKLSSSIEMLMQRAAVLEKGIATFRGQLPSKLQVDTAALVKEINELRKAMDLDRRQRVDQDTELLRRLADMESSEAVQFNEGSRQLGEAYAQFKDQINHLARSEEVSDNKTEGFKAFILEEIAGMKNMLASLSQSRENTDDEIVLAMNQYTSALGKALQAANNR
eukprot:TRINITY_DN105972_c0_g1_i1.p1 TRINITY_DN105972_c0_g1~~TRINITY_DN105972_c0_g1_i1.p1  ORF type:complete len:317 (-),score=85.59 TRINITY_DN105972_c0_g1_i1:91-993(-)